MFLIHEASVCQKEMVQMKLWLMLMQKSQEYLFFWPGFREGARATASAGPAPSGGAAPDHAAAALVPQPALQKAVPQLTACSRGHTGG